MSSTEPSSCPLWVSSKRKFNEKCGGARYLTGQGADAVLVCERCGAKWTLDGKESA